MSTVRPMPAMSIRGAPRFAAIVAAIGLLGPARASADDLDWFQLFRGVRYATQRIERPVPAQIHAVEVDLCAAGVSLRATAPAESASSTSTFGERTRVQLAVNGDFFREDLTPIGLAMSGGRLWDGAFDGRFDGFIAFGPGAARISTPLERVTAPPRWMSEVVGGLPALVLDGATLEIQPLAFCQVPNPRTAVGLSKDRRRLYLVVVDGRSKQSVGMTCGTLARWMHDLGVDRALNLDGGGSSTLWISGLGVINEPSDGQERIVSNHLGVYASGVGPAVSCPDPIVAGLDGVGACGAPVGWGVLPLWSEWSGVESVSSLEGFHEDRGGALCGPGDRFLTRWDRPAP